MVRVEGLIRKNKSTKKDEKFARAIYVVLKSLKGHSLQDVLSMTVPQFYWLLDAVCEEIEMQNKEYKKQKSKSRRR